MMNTEDLFWNLVSNQHITGYRYNHKFSFQTVFYQSHNSYQLCECGFEHEYLDYIAENGELDKEKCNKTLDNIMNGKCPHVDMVDKIYVKQTRISAAHIAAAVGTEAAMCYIRHDRTQKSAIFNVSPFSLAILKGNIDIVNLLQRDEDINFFKPDMVKGIIFSQRSRRNYPGYLDIEKISPILYCIRKRKIALLKNLLDSGLMYRQIDKTLEHAFRHSLKDVQEDIVKYIRQNPGIQSKANLEQCAVSAVVYDQPSILHEITQELSLTYDYNCLRRLFFICNLLRRTECSEALKLPHKLPQLNLGLSSLCLLNKGFEDRIEEIRSKLKTSRLLQEEKGKEFRLYNSVIDNPDEVEFLLEIGTDVDYMLSGETHLTHLLKARYKILPLKTLRQTVMLLIQENPSLDLNKSAVELAIDLDEFLKTEAPHHGLDGEFVMDNELHSLLGVEYDIQDPLNYFGPLLIQCGFPVTNEVLSKALEKPLYSVELEYLHQVLSCPRSLTLSCRDVFRKHFKGRQLHSFINNADVPKRIKDFILLRGIL